MSEKSITGEGLHALIVELERTAYRLNGTNSGYLMADAAAVLRKFYTAEPVADVVAWSKEGEERTCDIRWRRFDVAPGPLYSIPQLQIEQQNIPKNIPDDLRARVRQEHAEWAQSTFGDIGPIGPLKHLSKEALEAAEMPGDLLEWADMQFLLWDAQRRAGISDDQITGAMVEKLAINKQRAWPEPKDGEPRFHIAETPEKETGHGE